ncbi:MAG TPA: M20/M25/M40 family metallo-hydrolase [Vicinamibacterales bacterium]|jgi:acetylornithine deacetylase/succinyl-diaminopimelate desuccinylase-like protein|nr:M20/M25/M40 family metallo-hydrolase [Vicinamibacterales bacterium]
MRERGLAACFSALVIAVLTALAVVSGAQEAGPPAVRFTTDEAFDASTIQPYAGRHDAVYGHIDANIQAHVKELQRWVRQPSVSAQNRGIAEMAKLLANDLNTLGFKEVAIVPTAGHPGVFGFFDAGAPRTLVVYMMYDVQPEETGWQVPAFEGAIKDTDHGRVLMARGATNQKGPERAFLNALDSILKTAGKLPVNLLIVAEGEEELGSPNYGQVIDKYEARLQKSDGVFFPLNAQDASGAASLPLGVKGILSMELEATGGLQGGPTRAEIHSSLKAIVDAPAWRLTQALATLVGPDGNRILVPGYYDAIRQPLAEEQRLVNGLARSSTPAREEAMRKGLGVERFTDNLSGRDLLSRLLFTTTININGMWTGYTGEGMKTILPHVARARLDSRLVPNQTPDAQLELIKKHLTAKGFSDVKVRKISGYPPAQTSVDTPLVRAAIGVFNKYGATPTVAPRLAGSAPYYIFTDRVKLPMVMGGMGHGSGAHAPDEFLVIEPRAGSKVAGLAQIEKWYVDFLYAFAGMK